jgi:hypothetical protein
VADWILPAVLVAAWALLWRSPRRLRLWFLPAAGALSILCFPAGLIASETQLSGAGCGARSRGCFSTDAVHWWLNGLHGLLTCGALVIVTLAIELVLRILRRAVRP